MKNSFINDKYKQTRGGYSRMYKVYCEKCSEFICKYQKDGPGIIKRLYIDRMSETNILSNKDLYCVNKHHIGNKFIYEKEDRPAYRIYAGAIIKSLK